MSMLNRALFVVFFVAVAGCTAEPMDCYGLDCDLTLPLSQEDAEFVCDAVYPPGVQYGDELGWRCGGGIGVGDRDSCVRTYTREQTSAECSSSLGRSLACLRALLEVPCEEFYEFGIESISACSLREYCE